MERSGGAEAKSEYRGLGLHQYACVCWLLGGGVFQEREGKVKSILDLVAAASCLVLPGMT